MDKFNSIIEKTLVPIATKLNNQRHVAAIRDAFMFIFPLTLSASMVILINNLIFSPDGFIAKILFLPKFFPDLEKAQQYLAPAANGTINLMSIFIAFLVASILAKHFEADDMLAGITSIACFIILYPVPFELKEGGPNVMETTYLGAQGLFVAMIVGCLVGEFLPKLFKNKHLKITMPDMVPPAVARSFSGLIPIVIAIMICSVASALLTKVAPGGLNELIYTSIQTPLRQLGGNIFGILFIAFIQNLLWSIGIHGPNTLNAIRSAIFTEPDLANLAHINSTGSVKGIPYPETWGMLNDAFANMGGSGMTLGLIIAIFIASRRSDYREIAKMSLVPGLFNINEPLIFGLPIVLNPILIFPFILAPLVNIMIGYVVTVVFQLIPSPAIGVPWTTPGPLIPFLGTGGNLLALVIGFVCLAISVLIYLPFVVASNKVIEKQN
ncbi:PTS sugar transporter subunit IIC [Vagococcus intermedius]|uniref:Permease IIC component n=1 Tax=Vagococcus intermedius TaxID=2991418 RepID=A0AAF0I6N5_9ENTE|nr:PTS sugar transporter subunit IIC [Vagococcus intermedius]WEG73678.1 PTS sugar transporter subunit IIC [Vagococcus intermedius]WEG75762.1 PTS sugar transporter subunit IIC [Vagococcus intermedius]